MARGVLDRVPELPVIGITGSSGKTSTKDLLASVLSTVAETVAPVGSLNGEIGVPLTVCRVTPTTRFLVAEMGARGIGHIAYLTRIAPPWVGIVLNVGTAHVGEFGSRANIAIAKAELAQALPADGLAVLNADDPLVAAMAVGLTCRVRLVGRSPDAEVRAEDVVLDERGRAAYGLVCPQGRARITLRQSGAHHVGNSLAVAAAALELGLTLEQVAAGLSGAEPANRWRMEVTERPDGVVVVNDAYNANPDSMRAALDALAAMARRGSAGRCSARCSSSAPAAPPSTRPSGRMPRAGDRPRRGRRRRGPSRRARPELGGRHRRRPRAARGAAATRRHRAAQVEPRQRTALARRPARGVGDERDPPGPTERWPRREGRPARGRRSRSSSRCSAPRCSSSSSSSAATASSSATTVRRRTTRSAARPTMGGAVILAAMLGGLLPRPPAHPEPPTASGLLVLFLMAGLGFVGFLDDFIKISKQRSLGLRSKQKLAGQALVGVIFAGARAAVPQRPVPHARLAVHLVRPRHQHQPRARRQHRRRGASSSSSGPTS